MDHRRGERRSLAAPKPLAPTACPPSSVVVASPPVDAWTFIWLMVFLKIPIAAMLGIVWWAVRQDTDPDTVSDDDGGIKHLPPKPRHPHRPRLPRTPRRGPHGGESSRPPARARTVTARARHLQH